MRKVQVMQLQLTKIDILLSICISLLLALILCTVPKPRYTYKTDIMPCVSYILTDPPLVTYGFEIVKTRKDNKTGALRTTVQWKITGHSKLEKGN